MKKLPPIAACLSLLVASLALPALAEAPAAKTASTTASAKTSAVRLDAIRFARLGDGAEFTVTLSGPTTAPATIRAAGAHVAFILPGVSFDGERRELDAKAETGAEGALFAKALLLRRAEGTWLAVRATSPSLVQRARIEGRGPSLRLRLYRTEAAAKVADAARELEDSLGEPSGAVGKPLEKNAKAVAATSSAAPKSASSGETAKPTATSQPTSSKAPVAVEKGAGPRAVTSAFSLRIAAVLGFLFVAAAGAFWLVRRNRAPGKKGKGPIQIIAAQSLMGQKRHIVLVEVHGERLLLGSADGGITLLARIDEPDDPAAFEASLDAELRRSGDTSFGSGLLAKLREGLQGRPATAAAPRAAVETRDPPPAPAAERTSAERPAPKEKERKASRAKSSARAEAEPVADVATRSPAWTVALSGRKEGAAADAASSTAELIRRKLAELNRA